MFVVSLQRSCVLPSHGSITSLSFLESSDIKWWQALNCVQESTHQWHHNHLFLVLIQIQVLWSHSCFEFLNSVKVCMESASCCLAHKPVRNTSCNVASEHTAMMVWGNETSVNQEDVLCFKVKNDPGWVNIYSYTTTDSAFLAGWRVLILSLIFDTEITFCLQEAFSAL